MASASNEGSQGICRETTYGFGLVHLLSHIIRIVMLRFD
jgi:hypothetical protein